VKIVSPKFLRHTTAFIKEWRQIIMNDNISKELVESLINIAEQEILAEFEKAKPELLML
jgi:hypothetical protein